MDPLPGTESPPPLDIPPTTFVAHWMRLRGLVGLIVAGGLCVLAVLALTAKEGKPDFVTLAACALLALVHFAMFVHPSRVRIAGNTFELLTPLHVTTPIENLRALGYNGTGLAVVFSDLDQVHGGNEKMRQEW